MAYGGGRQHTKKDRNCLHLFVPAKNLFSADSVIINPACYTSFAECAGCGQWLLQYMAAGFVSVKISKINREKLIEPPGSCIPGVTSVRIKINISLPLQELGYPAPLNEVLQEEIQNERFMMSLVESARRQPYVKYKTSRAS